MKADLASFDRDCGVRRSNDGIGAFEKNFDGHGCGGLVLSLTEMGVGSTIEVELPGGVGVSQGRAQVCTPLEACSR